MSPEKPVLPAYRIVLRSHGGGWHTSLKSQGEEIFIGIFDNQSAGYDAAISRIEAIADRETVALHSERLYAKSSLIRPPAALALLLGEAAPDD